MPYRLGKLSHHERSGARTGASTVAHFLEGRQGRAAGGASPAATTVGPSLSRLHSILRVFPRRHRPRLRSIASNRVDVLDRQAAHAPGAGIANDKLLNQEIVPMYLVTGGAGFIGSN